MGMTNKSLEEAVKSLYRHSSSVPTAVKQLKTGETSATYWKPEEDEVLRFFAYGFQSAIEALAQPHSVVNDFAGLVVKQQFGYEQKNVSTKGCNEAVKLIKSIMGDRT